MEFIYDPGYNYCSGALLKQLTTDIKSSSYNRKIIKVDVDY